MDRTSSKDEHWVATVKVVKVTRERPVTTDVYGNKSGKAHPAREVTEVASLTIKASELVGLKDRLAGHIGLILDDGIEDDFID